MAEADSVAGIAQEINRHAVAIANKGATRYFQSYSKDDPRSLIQGVEIFRLPDPNRPTLFGVTMDTSPIDPDIEEDDRLELRQIGRLSVREALAERPDLLGILITSYAARGENFFTVFLR